MSTIRWFRLAYVATVCSATLSCTPLERQILPAEEEDAGPLSSTDDSSEDGSQTGGRGGSKAASNGKLSTGAAGKGAGSAGRGGSAASRNGANSRGIDDSSTSASRGGAGGADGEGSASARNRSGQNGEDGEGAENGEGGENGEAPGKAGCSASQLECEDACVPNDKRNCGRCGHDCTALVNVIGTVGCSDGACVVTAASCAPGWAHCSDDPDEGCETDITQPMSCGKCGVECDESKPMCSAGKCVSGCPDSLPTLCSRTCTNTKMDAMHCGECGNACTTDVDNAQPVCMNGTCKFECKGDFMKCGESCADLETDNENCGSCGNACTGGKMCKKGSCECPSGLNDCNGTCKADSPTSCGESCEVCRSGVAGAKDMCKDGKCDFKCNDGLSLCNGECVDTSSDNDNCGICGYRCKSPESCGLGLCLCPFAQHECDGFCVSNYSEQSCGLLSCSPCPAPAPGYDVRCDGFSCVSKCTDTTNTFCTP